jgi:hypothetical protein
VAFGNSPTYPDAISHALSLSTHYLVTTPSLALALLSCSFASLSISIIVIFYSISCPVGVLLSLGVNNPLWPLSFSVTAVCGGVMTAMGLQLMLREVGKRGKVFRRMSIVFLGFWLMVFMAAFDSHSSQTPEIS